MCVFTILLAPVWDIQNRLDHLIRSSGLISPISHPLSSHMRNNFLDLFQTGSRLEKLLVPNIIAKGCRSRILLFVGVNMVVCMSVCVSLSGPFQRTRGSGVKEMGSMWEAAITAGQNIFHG